MSTIAVSHTERSRFDPRRQLATTRRWLVARPSMVAEVVSLSALVTVSGLFARPLLEEWGFIAAFNSGGLARYPDLIKNFPLRPLQGVPFALQWLLSGGRSAGVSVGFAIVLLLKYSATRWALKGVVTGWSAWPVAMLVTVLPSWAGQWHLRFSAPQLSVVFLFCALGALFRAQRRHMWYWRVVATISTFLVLATYQALALCIVLLCLVVTLSEPVASGLRIGFLQALRAAGPVTAGYVAYGFFALATTRSSSGSGYEGELAAQSQLHPKSLADVWDIVSALYSTASLGSPTSPILFAGLLAWLGGVGGAPGRPFALSRSWAISVLLAVGLLPLLALPYAVSTAFMADPERVGFPVAVGFALVVVVVAAKSRNPGVDRRGAWLVVAAMLLGTGYSAAHAYGDYVLQRDLLVQTAALAEQRGAGSVIIRDNTGRLGDVYTMYPPIFEAALLSRGVTLQASICTPLGVDRIHPVARTLSILSTPRCEEVLSQKRPGLILDARWGPEGILFTPGE